MITSTFKPEISEAFDAKSDLDKTADLLGQALRHIDEQDEKIRRLNSKIERLGTRLTEENSNFTAARTEAYNARKQRDNLKATLDNIAREVATMWKVGEV